MRTINERALPEAEAREYVSIHERKMLSSETTSPSQVHETRASPPVPGVPPPICHAGLTLKARIEELSRKVDAGRKDTRDPSRSLLGRRANLEGSSGSDYFTNGASTMEKGTLSVPMRRFQTAGRRVIRQNLQRKLEASPEETQHARRLGRIELRDGDFEDAVEHLRLGTKGSSDHKAWLDLARAEVKAWERDPATGHERLRFACDAYRHSIDLLEPGVIRIWELPARLMELGGVYESFGSFEGALHIYQRIVSSMPVSRGFENVLFRCAVVMRYMSTLEKAPRESLLQSSLEHLDLIFQMQTQRKESQSDSAALLYADVCISLGEGSAVAKGWAKTSYQEVFKNRKSRGDANAIKFRDWDDWIGSPETQLLLAKEWNRKGEPALAVLAYDKALEAFERENEISPASSVEPSFSALMDASEALSSFQRFSRAEETLRKALTLEPENREANDFLRELLGDANFHPKEMKLQVVLYIQSKWRTRVWHGEYLTSLKQQLQASLEERLSKNRTDVGAREQLAYFFRDKHRPVLLYEDRCARIIQRLGRAGLFRLRWFNVKKQAYRKQLTNAMKLWRKSCYAAESRETIRARAASKYTPSNHKIVSVVALMDRQDEAAPVIQRAARRLLARKMLKKILHLRSIDVRRIRRKAAIRIQCQVRSHLARRELHRRTSLAAERSRAVVFIQRMYRARVFQWTYAVKRAQRAHARRVAEAQCSAACKLQAAWRMKLGASIAEKRRRAILDIQRHRRGVLARRSVKEQRNDGAKKIQVQYKRHRERLQVVRAIMAMQVSRERREARAREIERRYRTLEEERLRGGNCDGKALSLLEERRVARAANRRNRLKVKGSDVIRARRWRPHHNASSTPSSEALPSAPATLSTIPSLPWRAVSTAPLLTEDNGGETSPETEDCDSIVQSCYDVIQSASAPHPPPVGVENQKQMLSPASLSTSRLPCGKNGVPPDGMSPIVRENETLDSSPTVEGTPGDSSGPFAELHAVTSKCSPASYRRSKKRSPPVTTSPGLSAALACARGIGGRLGTPLGSPYPAPGEDWAEGRCASASARVEAKTAKHFGRDMAPSAPGSRYFPPFAYVGALPGSALSPVVFEMVQDAADDEEDAAAAVTSTAESSTLTRIEGWHGLTLYRPPGINRRSLLFQRALQLETIAFSPDMQSPLLAAPPSTPPRCHSKTRRLADSGRLGPPPATSLAFYGEISTASRAAAVCGRRSGEHVRNGWRGTFADGGTSTMRAAPPQLCDDFTFVQTEDGLSECTPRGWGAREEKAEVRARGGGGADQQAGKEPRRAEIVPDRGGICTESTSTSCPGSLKRMRIDRVLSPASPSIHAATSKPAKHFDSGDMIMAAGLLAHPESSLKRLVLHKAMLHDPAGQEALLKCLTINKLDCVALGGCTWFEQVQEEGTNKEKDCKDGQWWKKVCDTIRTNSFRLQELIVEGLQKGGDTLVEALGITLDDYFTKTFGRLSSISVVRCGISDDGAMAIARGIWSSSTLTHADLSANIISDVGVEALAHALLGDYPIGPKDNVKGGQESLSQRSRHRKPILKSLDLGQNRIMDPGGIRLGEVLPRSVSLESLTISYNFMMEDAAQALIKAAAQSRTILQNLHCEGNLFSEDMCGHIAKALEERETNAAAKHPSDASPQARAPDALDRSYWTRHACPSLRERTTPERRRERLDERSSCPSERNRDRSARGGTLVAIGTSGIKPQWTSEAPKALQSPPKVRRVTKQFPVLTTLAQRSCARRGRRHRDRGRGCRFNSDDLVSSSSLAASIGCHNVPAKMRTTESGGDADFGREAFDGRGPDVHRNLEWIPMDSVFRTGLGLGDTRFRGTGAV